MFALEPADGDSWSSMLWRLSYDLFIQGLPEGISAVSDIPADFEPAPLGLVRAEVVECIRAVWPSAEANDPDRLRVDSADGSIEIHLGSHDPVDSFAIHVRGGPSALGQIGRLLDALGVRALDPQDDTGLFNPTHSARAFARWMTHRDQPR